MGSGQPVLLDFKPSSAIGLKSSSTFELDIQICCGKKRKYSGTHVFVFLYFCIKQHFSKTEWEVR